MHEKAEEICKAVLEKITPKEDERAKIEALAEKLVKKVAEAAERFGVKAQVRLEGSVAKDTWLSEEPDIDVFMRLPTSIPREVLGEIAIKIAKKAVEDAEHIERFAEHPYLEAMIEGTRVNIVPCYEVKPGEWRSATDRTPYHTDYVKKRLDQRMRGETRLLKKFMKGIDIYGAEIKIGGFSGYLCELLIIHYGSFLKTLEAFSKLKKPMVIDIEGYYKGREDELKLLFKEPLIVVDPVDKARNVASAVQPQKLYAFVAAARVFLENPSMNFFYPPETQPLKANVLRKALKTRGPVLIFLSFKGTNAVPDILWGQLYKSQRALAKLLKLNEFNVLRSACWSDEENLNIMIFELESRFLPPIKKHLGPPLEKIEDCKKFIQKHVHGEGTISGPYIEDGRWTVILKRRYTDVLELLENRLKNDGGRSIGVAKEIANAILREVNIYVNEQIIKLYEVKKEFAKFLTEFLDGKPIWLKGA
ncbi:CCA tRNA nucleotidyltransferase [Candidatus Bathyarchaeota archaeon]|nr:CCA tRNA nucleotidyltransferase [Candidatus Bathyarchaeota archaeon]